MRSRWMLLFGGATVLYHWITGKLTGHARPRREPQIQNYGLFSALTVGMLHGIGAETPTQVLLFVMAAGAGGSVLGVSLLLVFVLGLLISNSLVTLLTTFGYVRARRNSRLYLLLGTITAVFSMVIGLLFITGQTSILPALLGG
jgi:high-affinity nickel-transport protein